jgi:membrane-associated phospholipid phosphatase
VECAALDDPSARRGSLRDAQRNLALVLSLAFLAVTTVVAAGWAAGLDRWVAADATTGRAPLFSSLALNFTALGSAPVITLIALSVVVYALSTGRPRILLAVLWTPLAFLMNELMKLLVHHPRPTTPMIALPDSYGFPSGHSVAASALFLTLALIAAGSERRGGPRRLLIGMGLGIALLVAWSRVYLGVHYLSDVVGGLLLGSAGAVAAAEYVNNR